MTAWSIWAGEDDCCLFIGAECIVVGSHFPPRSVTEPGKPDSTISTPFIIILASGSPIWWGELKRIQDRRLYTVSTEDDTVLLIAKYWFNRERKERKRYVQGIHYT